MQLFDVDSPGRFCIDSGVFIEDESIPGTFERHASLGFNLLINFDELDTLVPGTRMVLYIPTSCNATVTSITQSYMVSRHSVPTLELLDPFELGTTGVFSPIKPQAPILSIRETRSRLNTTVFESV